MYLGSLKLNDMLVIPCDTHNPTNGVAQTADAAPTFHIYKDNNPTPIMTGTLSLLNNPNAISHYTTRIMATGTIFAKNSNYDIYIRAVVAGYTGTMGHAFQIEAEVDSNTVSDTVGITTGTFLDALADKVWDEVLSGHLTPSSAGHTLWSRMPTGTVLVGDKTGFYLATPQNFDLIGNVSGTVSLVLNVQNPVTAGNVTGSVLGNVNGSVNSVVQPVGISTGSFILAIADQVWDEAVAQHLSAGSTGEKLNAAGGAGDPWSTTLPGIYVPGQAGHILASRMPTGTVLVGDKTGFSLSSPQNFNLIGNISGTFVGDVTGSVGSVLTMGATLLNKIADHVLRRPLASARASADGDAVTFRSLLGAVSKLVNRWRIGGSTLTVYEEDDTTAFGTQALTGTPGADPITESDTT